MASSRVFQFGLLRVEGYPDVVEDVCRRLIASGLSFGLPPAVPYSADLTLKLSGASSEYVCSVRYGYITPSAVPLVRVVSDDGASPYVWLWAELAELLPPTTYEALRREYKQRNVAYVTAARRKFKNRSMGRSNDEE